MTIEVRNAIIESTSLSTADHGCLSGWLYLDYGGSGQGFGGYSLYLPKDFKKAVNQRNYAGHFIFRCMEIAGVEDWGKLPGRTIRVRCEHSRVHAVGHILKDDWFDPKVEFETMEKAP